MMIKLLLYTKIFNNDFFQVLGVRRLLNCSQLDLFCFDDLKIWQK